MGGCSWIGEKHALREVAVASLALALELRIKRVLY